MKQRTNLHTISIVVFVVVLIIILYQAKQPEWRDHMQVDIATFHARATYFLDHKTWQDIGYNEYPPAATWLFALVGYFTNNPHDFSAYSQTFFALNVLLLIGHFVFFAKHGGKYASIIFSILVVATGPILLFRFDLLISLLVLWAWNFLRNGDYASGMLLLGIASSIKLYPAILVPLAIAEMIRVAGRPQLATLSSSITRTTRYLRTILAYGGLWLKKLWAPGWGFAAGFIIPVLAYFTFGGTWKEFLFDINVYNLKSIEPSSIWANILALANWLFGTDFINAGSYGTHGIISQVGSLSVNSLNKVSPILTVACTAWIIWTHRKSSYLKIEFAFFLVLIFTVFSKVLNPQYLWWFVVFLPYLSEKLFSQKGWLWVYSCAIGALILTKYIYPLHFSEFLSWFNPPIKYSPFLLILSIRNVALIALTVIFGVKLLSKQKSSSAP